jgi:flotillin
MLEHLDHLADASAKAISNIKFDKVVVWENGSGNGSGATANFLQSFARSLPPMLQTMRDIGGVEIPESLIKLSDGKLPAAGDGAAANGKGTHPTPAAT